MAILIFRFLPATELPNILPTLQVLIQCRARLRGKTKIYEGNDFYKGMHVNCEHFLSSFPFTHFTFISSYLRYIFPSANSIRRKSSRNTPVTFPAIKTANSINRSKMKKKWKKKKHSSPPFVFIFFFGVGGGGLQYCGSVRSSNSLFVRLNLFWI